jgi:hypothetical protein
MGRLRPGSEGRAFWPMALGLFLYTLLAELPVIGWLFDLVAVILGLGALVLYSRRWWPKGGTSPAPLAEPVAAV